MIVSFRHRFVFVAIPKTGTHAVREALRPHLGSGDWEQCDLFEKKRFPVAILSAIGHGHITCREMRPFMPGNIWTSSFKFCFARDPYDRFVSCCRFFHRDTNAMAADPLGTMKRAIRSALIENHPLFRPQHELVADEHGLLMVDYVGRVESMDADFGRIGARIGIGPSPLGHVNVSGSAVSRRHVDDELAELIEARYARDFELFGYEMTHATTTI